MLQIAPFHLLIYKCVLFIARHTPYPSPRLGRAHLFF